VTANSPDVYHRSFDPNIGTILTAFTDRDPQNPSDPWDILTNWKSAIDELDSLGVDEVTFAVYRNAQGGYLTGGPTIATVESAVQYANEKGFSVTIFATSIRSSYRTSPALKALIASVSLQSLTQSSTTRTITRGFKG